jgi:hypothetical protein
MRTGVRHQRYTSPFDLRRSAEVGTAPQQRTWTYYALLTRRGQCTACDPSDVQDRTSEKSKPFSRSPSPLDCILPFPMLRVGTGGCSCQFASFLFMTTKYHRSNSPYMLHVKYFKASTMITTCPRSSSLSCCPTTCKSQISPFSHFLRQTIFVLPLEVSLS